MIERSEVPVEDANIKGKNGRCLNLKYQFDELAHEKILETFPTKEEKKNWLRSQLEKIGKCAGNPEKLKRRQWLESQMRANRTTDNSSFLKSVEKERLRREKQEEEDYLNWYLNKDKKEDKKEDEIYQSDDGHPLCLIQEIIGTCEVLDAES
jgi:hypothetical protein